MSKASKIFIPLYLLFFVVSFFYVKSVLKHEDISEKDKTKPVIIKEYAVTDYLKVIGPSFVKAYKVERKNTQSVMNMMENIRNNQGFVFEKIEYTHGTEIDSVFQTSAPEGYRWKIFLNGTDITNNIKNILLTNNSTYELKIVPK